MAEESRETKADNESHGTLSHAMADRQTVSSDGQSVNRLADGVTFRDAITHVDARGSIVGMFDPRWEWHPDPFAYAYSFTVRPGMAKGWGLHNLHEDRYFLMQGELEIVLYDVRPDVAHIQRGFEGHVDCTATPFDEGPGLCLACRPQHRLRRCGRCQLPHDTLRSRES